MTRGELKQLIRETIEEMAVSTSPQWVVTFFGGRMGNEEFSIVVRGANQQAAISNGKRYVATHEADLIGYERDILDSVSNVTAQLLKK
jgi:ribosome biogenesis protein Nip4